MLQEEYPFVFSLNYIIKSHTIEGCELNYYSINIDNNRLLIGIFYKSNSAVFQNKTIEGLLSRTEFWNQSDFQKLKSLQDKKQRSRLYEWLLSRILIKFGLPIYLAINYRILELNPDQVFLSNNQLNGPSIRLNLHNNSIDFKYIPDLCISYTNNAVYIALGSIPIGIDSEIIKEHSESWRNKIALQQEINHIKKIIKKKDFDNLNMIYTIIWALKESTIKVNGKTPLGLLPKIKVNLLDTEIITEIPGCNIKFKNFISIFGNSVFVITI